VDLYEFTPQAEADLIDIGNYTLSSWGAEQAAHYLSRLLKNSNPLPPDRSSAVPAVRFTQAFAALNKASTLFSIFRSLMEF
jgi:hypothetical protein